MDNLKVVLIEPGETFAEEGCGVMMKQTPSLGLVSIATVLNKHSKIEAFVIDNQIPNKSSLNDFVPDIVGISCYSYNRNSAYNIAKGLKKTFPETIILLGGPFPTAVPKRVLQDCYAVDYVVLGEGENSLLEFCENIISEKNKNIIGIADRKTTVFESRLDVNLNELPFPDWSLIKYSEYAKAYSYNFKSMKFLYPISTSRGCVFSSTCSFCAGDFLGNKIRERSPQSIYEEMSFNYHNYLTQYFYFLDPNFLYNKNRVYEFCDLIIENMIKKGKIISWKCQSRASFADLDLFKKMKEAGCELIFYGFESANDEVLKYNKGNQTREMIKNAVDCTKQANIKVRASFILGLPFDNLNSMTETIHYAKTLKMDGFAVHTLDLYPGTKIWNEVHNNWGGLKLLRNDLDFVTPSRSKPIINVGEASPKDMQSLQTLASTFQINSYNAKTIMERNFVELDYYRKANPEVFSTILATKTKEIQWASLLLQLSY